MVPVLRLFRRQSTVMRQIAFEVNQVFNLANAITLGYSIGSATVQKVIAHHGKARKQFKRSRLRWRVSGGASRSLGWVPFKSKQAQWQNGCVKFAGRSDSFGLAGYKCRADSFSEDSRGLWYFNICVEVETQTTTSAVRIDLGLKDYAILSEGDPLIAGKFFAIWSQHQTRRNKRVKKPVSAPYTPKSKTAVKMPGISKARCW